MSLIPAVDLSLKSSELFLYCDVPLQKSLEKKENLFE